MGFQVLLIHTSTHFAAGTNANKVSDTEVLAMK